MGVLIDNRQNRYKIPLKKIQKKAQAVLSALDCPDGELSLLVVDDPQIAKLNKKYLNRNGPTNVIAFPMRQGEFANLTPQLLGDVVISVETAAREAKKSGISMQERFTQLLVHGVLHLFGYDHEENKQQARKMEEKSNELIKLIET
ncbi:MAG: rRNA maturation RNase YbeY [Desulfobacterales bacterium]|uniref:Endoribonuclease YbeY n=1 Tax=Candidatus Desulfatibia vada TaxID=2841696 RepID=A0A8J6P4M8_9BACT|nr:rRNA maturation RNase YbeY [Candidatus Desulfatibia vada]